MYSAYLEMELATSTAGDRVEGEDERVPDPVVGRRHEAGGAGDEQEAEQSTQDQEPPEGHPGLAGKEVDDLVGHPERAGEEHRPGGVAGKDALPAVEAPLPAGVEALHVCDQ